MLGRMYAKGSMNTVVGVSFNGKTIEFNLHDASCVKFTASERMPVYTVYHEPSDSLSLWCDNGATVRLNNPPKAMLDLIEHWLAVITEPRQ